MNVNELLGKITELVEKHVKRFQKDLSYDIMKICKIDGFFHAIYVIRESGTHLLDLSNEYTDFEYLRHYLGSFGNNHKYYIIATNDGLNWHFTEIPKFATYREQF